MMGIDIDELQEEQVRKALLRQQQQQDDLKAVLSTPAGRRLLWWLLEHTGVFRQSFTTDAAITAFNEGRRSSGLFLLGALEAVQPGTLGELMKENTND